MTNRSWLPTVAVVGTVVASMVVLVVAGVRAWQSANDPLVAECGCGALLVTPGTHDFWPAALLLAVAAIMIGRFLWSLGRSVRMDRRMQRRFSELRTAQETSRGGQAYTIVESSEVFAVTAGVFHPHVYLSRGFAERLDPEESLMVVGHELAHARAYHPAWWMLARAAHAAIALWPGSRSLLEYIRARQELEADHQATNGYQQTDVAARVMLKLATVEVSAGSAWSMMEARVDRLLDPHQPLFWPRSMRWAWGGVVAMVMVAIGVGAAAVSASAPATPDSAQCVDRRRLCAPSPVRPPMTTLRSTYGSR